MPAAEGRRISQKVLPAGDEDSQRPAPIPISLVSLQIATGQVQCGPSGALKKQESSGN